MGGGTEWAVEATASGNMYDFVGIMPRSKRIFYIAECQTLWLSRVPYSKNVCNKTLCSTNVIHF